VHGQIETCQRYVEKLLLEAALAAEHRLLEHNERTLARAGIQGELATQYMATLEFLRSINIGTFSATIKEIVATLKNALVEEQVYRYSNNSMRHALFLYSRWFKTILLAEDPGFWYPTFYRGTSVNRRVATNYVYKRMLVGDVKGQEPHSVQLMCLFKRCDVGVVAFLLRILESISRSAGEARNDNWESKPVQLEDIEDHVIDRFQLKDHKLVVRDMLYSAIEELQRMASLGHLGLIWCTDVHDGDVVPASELSPRSRFVLTPAGHYVIDVLALKREFVYWCFMNADDVELPPGQAGGITRGQKLPYLSSCTEDYHIRATHFAVLRPLRKLFVEELSDLRKRGAVPESFTEEHLYLKIIDSLAANIAESDRFREETDAGETKSGFHALRSELLDTKADFIAMSKS
ncbi:MAG TPA: hypothetical protein VMI31_08610, partial [Fimbriimonadaceae bacterium]|nr:hypothetical protein [Fimbriimonadaceae bacterium]